MVKNQAFVICKSCGKKIDLHGHNAEVRTGNPVTLKRPDCGFAANYKKTDRRKTASRECGTSWDVFCLGKIYNKRQAITSVILMFGSLILSLALEPLPFGIPCGVVLAFVAWSWGNGNNIVEYTNEVAFKKTKMKVRSFFSSHVPEIREYKPNPQ